MSGSIPAGAGEPSRANLAKLREWVYPRGCGGAIRITPCILYGVGLSPRVRGSPVQVGTTQVGTGSIPAGAGEPQTRSSLRRRKGVYPRGCGGAPHK